VFGEHERRHAIVSIWFAKRGSSARLGYAASVEAPLYRDAEGA